MRGKEGAAEKEKVSEAKVKEEEASTAPLPDKVSSQLKVLYIFVSSSPVESSCRDMCCTFAVSGWWFPSVYC